jgi:hypothetical protein
MQPEGEESRSSTRVKSELRRELIRLRGGSGLADPQRLEKLGRAFWQHVIPDWEDHPPDSRDIAVGVGRMRAAIDSLGDDMRDCALVEFGLDRELYFPGLGRRQEALSEKLGISLKTVRRLGDRAVFALEQELVGRSVPTADTQWWEMDRGVAGPAPDGERERPARWRAGHVDDAERLAVADDFWRFPDNGPVRIICGEKEAPPPEADPRHRNFMALSSYVDLDSLIELFGHLRELNPHSDVLYTRPSLLRDDDLHAHLVIVGNLAAMQSAVEDWLPDLPIRQAEIDDIAEGEIFEVVAGNTIRQFGPVLSGDGSVVEDVGFLARMPSPTDPDYTLTICSGIFTRGVYAAVRCLTDQRVASANHAYLRSRFADAEAFGVLMKVLIVRRLVSTPRLDDVRARLFEFP